MKTRKKRLTPLTVRTHIPVSSLMSFSSSTYISFVLFSAVCTNVTIRDEAEASRRLGLKLSANDQDTNSGFGNDALFIMGDRTGQMKLVLTFIEPDALFAFAFEIMQARSYTIQLYREDGSVPDGFNTITVSHAWFLSKT